MVLRSQLTPLIRDGQLLFKVTCYLLLLQKVICYSYKLPMKMLHNYYYTTFKNNCAISYFYSNNVRGKSVVEFGK